MRRPGGRRAPEETVILTKKQISMIAVLGMSVIGFLVDKVLLDSASPETAGAAAPAPRPPSTAVPPAEPAPAAARVASDRAPAAGPAKLAGAPQLPAHGAAHTPLAERLEALTLPDGEPTDIREAFVPSAAWLASFEEAKPSGAREPPDSTADFARRHKLTSVLRRGNVGSAIVDGKVVEIGEQLDGYRLTGLTADSAVFRSPRHPKEVRLSIAGAAK
jgi:hypothetical protein